MKTASELATELATLFDEQRAGKVSAAQAVEMNNTVGKWIGLMKVQLEYHAARKRLGKSLPVMQELEALSSDKESIKK
jgi:hypothetical protein